MMTIRCAPTSELIRVETFYRETAYYGGLNAADTVIVAESDGELVGAVRLCEEEGILVLRGMRVREDFRRRGVGTQILAAVDRFVGERRCYCIAHRYLRSFYGQIEFDEIQLTAAPAFLQHRLAKYTEQGLDVIIMARERKPKSITAVT
ncbi:GNAT family N-acetyltransferase [candidate division KSB1 bacterium]|nr:GNAT family N-acetyltransferase [candidate division KSB1 bacterium]